MAYRPRRRKPSAVRDTRLSYGTSGNGELFQAHVTRELKALRGETEALWGETRALRGEIQALRGEIQALRRDLQAMRHEQDRINERLLLLITHVADDVAKLGRHMDRQDRRNARQDRINRAILQEIKRLRRTRSG